MKKNYEVGILGWAYSNDNAEQDHDLETCAYNLADNYRDAVRIAKELSLPENSHNTACKNNKVVCTEVVCYTETECTSYSVIFYERYVNGKKESRYKGGYPY